ncbi:MAG: rhodanese-like domain-containing protein [Burkholderiaceae bacterium]
MVTAGSRSVTLTTAATARRRNALSYPGMIVSSEWLASHLNSPDVRIVDATVHLPDTGRNARDEYVAEHIPGAVFLDFDRVADPDNPLPRKFPPATNSPGKSARSASAITRM